MRTLFINERTFRTTTSNPEKPDLLHLDLVRDGTPCGENLICLNQTCTSIFPHIDRTKCPTNHKKFECSGHGVSNTLSKKMPDAKDILFINFSTAVTPTNVSAKKVGWDRTVPFRK